MARRVCWLVAMMNARGYGTALMVVEEVSEGLFG